MIFIGAALMMASLSPLHGAMTQSSASVKPSERLIQIGIIPQADELTLAAEGRYAVTDREGDQYVLAARKKYLVAASEDGLRLGSLFLPPEARLTPVNGSDSVMIGSRRYRGTIILRRNPGQTVTVVDELGIEDYLLGVLPQEMDPGWPIEALKAQAVVARTFAYTQLGKYRKSGFDLTSDTRSQVFGGLGSESPVIRRAVSETRGEVLGYKGEILNVYYHACCGGHTADAGSVWGAPAPRPLKGVKDKYCARSPLAHWSAYFSYGDILAALQERRLFGGKLRAFRIGREDWAGYVRDFVARVGDEIVTVKAADLRRALGNNELKSARISRMRKLSKGIEFFGSGMGHGVGLCQWGARAQAEKGRGYEQILGFYFPGSVLSLIDE